MSPPTTTTSSLSPSETLELILHHLLPVLIVSSLSVKSFLSRWRTLHSHLSSLHSSLSHLQPPNPNPLLSNLLVTKLHPLLLSLLPLSSRCLDPSLPSGKLHLQSDLDIAISSLSHHLHHLNLLLQSPPIPPQSSSSDLVLSFPSPSSSSNSDLLLFLRDLFTRLQIGTADLQQKALESLLHLLSSSSSPSSTKISSLLAREFDLSVLVRLLDPAHPSLLLHHAASVVSILSSSSDLSRNSLFDQGALGPLLRLLDSGSNPVKEHSAAAIHSITSDPSNAWAVSAYAGVPSLVAACRPGGGSPAVHALAAGSLKNVCAAAADIRLAVVEEGAVAVLVDLLATGNALARKNSALCLWSLAAEGDDGVRVDIFREGGLERLVTLVGEAAEPEIMEHALRAILALSASVPVARGIASMPEFFIQLADLILIGHSSIQQVAACLVAAVSPDDEIRRSMARSLPALIKMLEYPKPATAQEAAANALMTLLTARLNRRELAKDEKSVSRLVQMLDPRREEVCKRYPVSVVLVLCASSSCRRKLADVGACQYLEKLVEVDVPGAKKALHRIAGNRLKNLFSIGWRE